MFDASGAHTGAQVVEALRGWSDAPVHTLVYTHGHVDHVGGSGAFVADAAARGHARPRVVAHAEVGRRFARYRATDGWNLIINARQFGGVRDRSLRIGGEGPGRFLPDDVAAPEVTYVDRLALDVGGLDIELRHGRGETDDHTWAWIPALRAVACGDFLIWNFPNAGNPQKVQRYPDEWAAALRQMAALEPELLLPAHGLPIGGAERIRRVLETVAGTLEDLVERVLALMNQGATLDEVVRGAGARRRSPSPTQPLYDEPEFVVRTSGGSTAAGGTATPPTSPPGGRWPPRWRPWPGAPTCSPSGPRRSPRPATSALPASSPSGRRRRRRGTRTSAPSAGATPSSGAGPSRR